MTTDADLEGLFNRLADGLASEADERTLAELLRVSAEARRAYREFMALHSALHWDYVAAAGPELLPPPAAPTPRPGWLAAFGAGVLLAGAAAVALFLLRPVPAAPRSTGSPRAVGRPAEAGCAEGRRHRGPVGGRRGGGVRSGARARWGPVRPR